MKRIILLGLAFLLTGIVYGKENVTLLGAGATFPAPLYSKMFDEYYKATKTQVNYQAIGSGGGIQQLITKTVDFGATDAPMNDKETKAAKDLVLHIPTSLGAVVLSYNIPGNPVLKFTPELVTDIFLGKITKWNDEKIKKVNPNVNLPNLAITTVHRSDGSGTTYTFSEYLCSVSPEWKTKVGTGKSLNWPNGLGGKGNAGVAGYIKQMPGAIGYVEVAYAKQNKMSYGMLQNKSGAFIEATLASVSAAANVNLPADTKVSLVNTDAKDGYPISTFTWLIVYKEQSYGGRQKDRCEETVKLLWWTTHEGQKFNEALDYGALPTKVVKIVENSINSITYNGVKVRK